MKAYYKQYKMSRCFPNNNIGIIFDCLALLYYSNVTY